MKINVRYTVHNNWMCYFNCRRIYCYFYAVRNPVTKPNNNQSQKSYIHIKNTVVPI